MNGITSRRRVGVFGLALLIAMSWGIFTVQAAPVKNFLVTVNPPVAVDDTATEFTLMVTNLDNNVLGAVQVAVPEGLVVNSVAQPLVTPSSKTWVSEWPVAGDAGTIRIRAATQTDRLGLGDTVTIAVNATTPDINQATNDVDLVTTWAAEGRQANNFNSDGNDFAQAFQERGQTFVFRDGDGLANTQLLTNQVLVVSGTASDCAVKCSGTDTQDAVTVTITVQGCDVGTLVVDATDLFAGDDPISVGGFYHYLDDQGTCIPANPSSAPRVTVDFLYDKSLGVKPGELSFAAYYGVPITEYDPLYVGDGNTLPVCKGAITVNCVASIKGAKDGVTARVILILLASDPGAAGFR
jgi:hypothetical protein